MMRALAVDGPADWPWIAQELSSRVLTYGYVAISTAIVFVGLGIVIAVIIGAMVSAILSAYDLPI